MATPVGQVFVLHSNACIQPNDSIMDLAALHISAPSEKFFTKSNPVCTLPEAIIFICFFKPNPFSASYTNAKPSRNGIPTELLNSNGAAPVPPSPPSTVIKSGIILV